MKRKKPVLKRHLKIFFHSPALHGENGISYVQIFFVIFFSLCKIFDAVLRLVLNSSPQCYSLIHDFQDDQGHPPVYNLWSFEAMLVGFQLVAGRKGGSHQIKVEYPSACILLLYYWYALEINQDKCYKCIAKTGHQVFHTLEFVYGFWHPYHHSWMFLFPWGSIVKSLRVGSKVGEQYHQHYQHHRHCLHLLHLLHHQHGVVTVIHLSLNLQ